jgi:hypothetical protein
MTLLADPLVEKAGEIRSAFALAEPLPGADRVLAAAYKLTVLGEVIAGLLEQQDDLSFRVVLPGDEATTFRVRSAFGPADRAHYPHVEIADGAGRIVGEAWLDLRIDDLEQGHDIAVIDTTAWPKATRHVTRLMLGIEACWQPFDESRLAYSAALRRTAAEPPSLDGRAATWTQHLVYSRHDCGDDLAETAARHGLHLQFLPL